MGSAEARPAPSSGHATAGGVAQATPTTDDFLASFAHADPSGLTAEKAGARASATSFDAKLQDAKIENAEASLEQAREQWVPRMTLTARYSRLSDLAPTTILEGAPGVNQVLTTQPSGPPGSGINTATAFSQPFPVVTFPSVLDNYLLQATVVVPVSDYLLRLGQSCSAASHAEDAARFDAIAARAKAAVEAKLAFYTWLRGRGAVTVAALSLADQRTHLDDVRSQFTAGDVSRAEVLRAEAALAAVRLSVEHARNAADLGEMRVRVAVHARDDERLVPGEGLGAALAAPPADLRRLYVEAFANRFEMKSLDASFRAAQDQEGAARTQRWPQISLFADAVYANPNARRVPLTAEWLATWDVGGQIVWSPNDAVGVGHAEADSHARAAELEALIGKAHDAIRIEVMEAVQTARESDVTGEAAHVDLASAEEARRVARQLFRGGRGTATMVTDAETDLVRARLSVLDAAVDARMARVRLEHVLGRDTWPAAAGLK